MTYEFDADFFETELLPRFLGLKFDHTENANAKHAFKRAIELDPDYADAYAYLAKAYVDTGDWIAARQYADAAAQHPFLSPDGSLVAFVSVAARMARIVRPTPDILPCLINSLTG